MKKFAVFAFFAIVIVCAAFFIDRHTNTDVTQAPSGQPTVTVTQAAAPTTQPTTSHTPERLSLRQRAQQMASENTNGWPALQKYLTSDCYATLHGLFNSDDPTDDPVNEPGTIKSVTVNGNHGTAVWSDPDGTSQTTHWIIENNEWRVTCEGLFDNTETTTTPASPTVGGPCDTDSELTNNHLLLCVHGVWTRTKNPNVTIGAPCSEPMASGVSTDGRFVQCRQTGWTIIAGY